MSDYGVIFDMDGVLVDSYQAHFESWRRVATKRGLQMTEADFARTFGRTSREIIRQLWPGRFSDEDVSQFDGEKEAAYREILRHDFPQMPGAGDLLAALHEAGFRLAIGSSGPKENVALVVQCMMNGHLISATVDGSEVSRGKPDPQVFLLAAKKLGLRPEQCAVVEDAIAGVEAARRAGMAAIGLTGTARRQELSKWAHLVVDSLKELTVEIVGETIRKNHNS